MSKDKPHNGFNIVDRLGTPAHAFYPNMGVIRLAKALKNGKHEGIDGPSLDLLGKAYEREYMEEAKQYQFMRRIHSPNYIHRCDDGKTMTLDNFKQLGPRWVRSCVTVCDSTNHGWYTDGLQNETIEGVVLCFTRHGDGKDEEYFGESRGKGRAIYMAGTQHSEWVGVTLDLDTTDNPKTAARWADQMAEREAESCREEDEKWREEEAKAEAAELVVEEEHFA